MRRRRITIGYGCFLAMVSMVADGWAALPRECARLVERAFDDISLMAVDTAGRAPKRVHLIIKADRATHLAALRSPPRMM